ncbi:coproporphyrinogen III oxidase [Ralstonia solanacearum]|uniref:coproporphyrinogen III oxidase n=1 Tax=Ralstonia solanacearum TaxID=305 RepID=UPI000A1067CA|nr:coproporphyrinogen III oxidase [Ralstonia solanacearum]
MSPSTVGAFIDEKFCQHKWETSRLIENLGGSDRTYIQRNGPVLERDGVRFSHEMVDTMPLSATANRPEMSGRGFEAMGVSEVFHPRNPYELAPDQTDQ